MDHVIEIAEGDVIELHVQAPALEGQEDTDGFAQTPYGSQAPGTLPIGLPPIRIAVVRNLHPGPPIELTSPNEVQGYMWKLDPSEPVWAGEGGGGGAPINLLFEWVSDPTGTFLKYYLFPKK
jgi:hypothetical protein